MGVFRVDIYKRKLLYYRKMTIHSRTIWSYKDDQTYGKDNNIDFHLFYCLHLPAWESTSLWFKSSGQT